jgi:hypothetical protein
MTREEVFEALTGIVKRDFNIPPEVSIRNAIILETAIEELTDAIINIQEVEA